MMPRHTERHLNPLALVKQSKATSPFQRQHIDRLNLTTSNRMRVSDLRVPQCVPTIRKGINDTLVITAVVGNISYTIPAGNYDGFTLASIIQQTLRATSGFPWVVTHDTVHLSMTISNTIDFQILGGTYWKQLSANPYTRTPDGKSYTFQFVSVLGADVFYLCSPQFSNIDRFGPNGVCDVLVAANVTVPYGGVMDYSLDYETWTDCPSLSTNQLSFQLRDRA
jgi:hypothetical protein